MLFPFEEIINHYKRITPLIIECSKINKRKWYSPYPDFDIVAWFSPIEKYTWETIRCFGKAPLYPQYPVGNVFIDFANPFVKIGLECDGKEFHKNKQRDYERDKTLSKLGWTIYRATGFECNKVLDEYYDRYDYQESTIKSILREYYSTTIEGIINAIGIVHFEYKTFDRDLDEQIIAQEYLEEHKSKIKSDA